MDFQSAPPAALKSPGWRRGKWFRTCRGTVRVGPPTRLSGQSATRRFFGLAVSWTPTVSPMVRGGMCAAAVPVDAALAARDGGARLAPRHEADARAVQWRGRCRDARRGAGER